MCESQLLSLRLRLHTFLAEVRLPTDPNMFHYVFAQIHQSNEFAIRFRA